MSEPLYLSTNENQEIIDWSFLAALLLVVFKSAGPESNDPQASLNVIMSNVDNLVERMPKVMTGPVQEMYVQAANRVITEETIVQSFINQINKL